MREKPSPPHPPRQLKKNVRMHFVLMIIPYVSVQKLRFYLLYTQSNSEFKTINWIFYFWSNSVRFLEHSFFYINLISSTPVFYKIMVFLDTFVWKQSVGKISMNIFKQQCSVLKLLPNYKIRTHKENIQFMLFTVKINSTSRLSHHRTPFYFAKA